MQFDWNEQRQAIFQDRYALKEGKRIKETNPNQMLDRVARALAFNDAEAKEFRYDLLDEFRFLPAGRILSGAGSEQYSATYYNCFVLGVDPIYKPHGVDSRDAILNTISKMVEITCRGGGVGVNWSVLRPDGSIVKGVHGASTGAVGWMRGADALADQVRQGGSRTAALMFVLDCWHPDIEMFIRSKKFSRANFSVVVTDQFMESLKANPKSKWEVRFPDTLDPAYDLLWDGDIDKWEMRGRKTEHGEMDIGSIWEGICSSAIDRGSPGLIFIDACNRASNTRLSEKIICTNPCGEQPLPKYGSCNLGSLNLVSFCGNNGDINRGDLSKVIKSAVKFLDNVIDKSPPLYPEIDSLQKLYRRIGLGTMGLADVLLLNKIRYGSQESLDFISDLYSFIKDEAFIASSGLARERGPAPAYSSDEIETSMAFSGLNDAVKGMMHRDKLRNLAVLTQAPTGTTSILAGVSSGIEPIFSPEYKRKDATGEFTMRHPLFAGEEMSYHVTAYDVTPEEHIMVQACMQKFIDSGISKTVNLPACATEEDADKIFRTAYDMGVKGITIYKGGSLDDICKSCSI